MIRATIKEILEIGVLAERRIVVVYFKEMSHPDDKGFSFILCPILPTSVIHGRHVYEYSCVKVTKGIDAKWQEVGLYVESKSTPKELVLLDQRRLDRQQQQVASL